MKKKDLGVTICSDLKPGKNCSEIVKTAYKFNSFIGRTFEFKSEKVIFTLFNARLRPYLEYCVHLFFFFFCYVCGGVAGGRGGVTYTAAGY